MTSPMDFFGKWEINVILYCSPLSPLSGCRHLGDRVPLPYANTGNNAEIYGGLVPEIYMGRVQKVFHKKS